MDIVARNNVQIEGEGSAVLLYGHGFGCNQSMWSRITPAFRASHRQILFDYVGSGQSDIRCFDPSRYSRLEGYAEDLLEVCEALNLSEGITFIGHSVSASIGLLASIARPRLFERLVLLGPSPCFLNHPPDYFGGFERDDLDGLLALMDQNYIGWAHYLAPAASGLTEDAAATRELTDSFCSTEPSTMRVFAEATFFADHRSELPKVSRPCLIIQHRRDALAPATVGEYLHRHLKGSELCVLDVAGHCAHMTHPDVVVAAIRKFLQTPAGAA